MKSLDASMGAKMVGVDVNFTRFICNELQQDAEHRARLLPALSLLEKVKMSDFLNIWLFDCHQQIIQITSHISVFNRRFFSDLMTCRFFCQPLFYQTDPFL